MTSGQMRILAGWLRRGFGELQSRAASGDVDDQLTEIIDMFEAYFKALAIKLGHDRVSISTWETYAMVKRRDAKIRGIPWQPR